jgi:hypothetical protein
LDGGISVIFLGDTTMDQQQSMTDFFGPVIHSYTRAQAIEDGVLVDVTETAKEAGLITIPVALTRAVWEDCVAWNDDDNKRQTYQDESGRLWDVLYMLNFAIKCNRAAGKELLYQLRRVPRGGRGHMARLVTLKAHIGAHIGPGDNGELVITIMLPHED